MDTIVFKIVLNLLIFILHLQIKPAIVPWINESTGNKYSAA